MLLTFDPCKSCACLFDRLYSYSKHGPLLHVGGLCFPPCCFSLGCVVSLRLRSMRRSDVRHFQAEAFAFVTWFCQDLFSPSDAIPARITEKRSCEAKPQPTHDGHVSLASNQLLLPASHFDFGVVCYCIII